MHSANQPVPSTNYSDRDVLMASQWAEFYRFRDYQPLPSSPQKKRPLVRYAQWWDHHAPPDLFVRHPSTNLQIMTGRRWGLLVIDLDGESAIEQWDQIIPSCPRTWTTHSGGGGRHLWFSISPDLPELPKARLWGVWDQTLRDGKGDWKPRMAIERLCDHSLVVAPPSIHPTTGKRYRFLAGRSPKEIARPAPAPPQILALQPLHAPRPEKPAHIPIARKAHGVPVTGRWDWRLVLDAIPDKRALAASWGLRIANPRPNASGWCECHAIGREDRHPSASFHPESGRYWEPGSGSVGFFNLAVQLGLFSTWQEACNSLGESFAPHLKIGA